ncbi:hypothetical protein [Aeromonas sp. Y311-2]|uniref:hypothetical protein n=1 Tax=Aeromonas sp. Y311-2 TaxID=2990507 RepID=UPI0022E233FF|nr:hypothetical protein [Aeromonas sp. Y311-2]
MAENETEIDLKRLDGGERLLAISALYGSTSMEIPVEIPERLADVLASSKRFIRDYRVSWNSVVSFGADRLRNALAMDIKQVAGLLSQVCNGESEWDNNPQSPIEGYTEPMAIAHLLRRSPSITLTSAPQEILESIQDQSFLNDAIFQTATAIGDIFKFKVSAITHGGFAVDMRSIESKEQMIRAIPLLLCGAQSTRSESLAFGLDKIALRNSYRDEDELAEAIQCRFGISRAAWANAAMICLIDHSNNNHVHARYSVLFRLIRRFSLQGLQGEEGHSNVI